jgi:hypothetical protein
MKKILIKKNVNNDKDFHIDKFDNSFDKNNIII